MSAVNINGREKRKLDLATVIGILNLHMRDDKAYYVSGLLKIVKKHHPPCSRAALRRYLIQMENLGLLTCKKDGRYKVYAKSEAARSTRR